MDHHAFDRLARILGAAVSRRAGLAAAIASAIGAAAATGAADAQAQAQARTQASGHKHKRRRGGNGGDNDSPKPEGPCGDRSRKDNLCTKDKQCCTNYCKKGLKNKDGKGRCRCIKKKKPCRPNQKCCGKYICLGGICTLPRSGGIPTGQACVAGVDTCESADASCIPYFQADPSGTYCLLANGKACAAATDCGSKDCAGGVCAAEVCTVCASGCPYPKVQAAIDDVSEGATIRIAAGTYPEDLTVPNMDLTLTNCNGGAVTLVNVTGDTRTLMLGDSSDSAPFKTVTIRNLTITGNGTPVAGDPTPVAPAVGGGGITAYTNLILEGTTKLTGCNWLDSGGGLYLDPVDDSLTVTVRGMAEISDNFADGEGGGIYIDDSAMPVFLQDSAKITRNYATNNGGGLNLEYEISLEISGNVEISHNRTEGYGGGFYIYCGRDVLCLKMSGNASIVFNTADGYEGGGIYFYDATDTYPYTFEMSGNALIADNQVINADTYGAGVYSGDSGVNILMKDNAKITRNTVVDVTTKSSGGGYYGGGGQINIEDQAAIIDNNPGNCDSYTTEAGSKLCGVA